MQDDIHDIEDDAQARQSWTAPSLTRLDAGAAEAFLFVGPDGFGSGS
ncbi:MAG: hypothetical protein U1E18_31400 [Brevundimonas sp.]|nr:hypothetical protein [Brevundimonas sp.]MDZ4114080.1 hypothetical protein [Brevundimonas sp.]